MCGVSLQYGSKRNPIGYIRSDYLDGTSWIPVCNRTAISLFVNEMKGTINTQCSTDGFPHVLVFAFKHSDFSIQAVTLKTFWQFSIDQIRMIKTCKNYGPKNTD